MNKILLIISCFLLNNLSAKNIQFPSKGTGKSKSNATVFLSVGYVTKQYDGSEFTTILDSTQIMRDSLGNVLEQNTFQQYFTGAWLNITKTIYTYNAINDMVEEVNKAFNFVLFQPLNVSRTQRNIDAQHRIIDATYSTWNLPTNAWRNSEKTQNSFAGNNLNTSISQTWDTLANSWQNSRKFNYTFNNNNQIITQTTFNFTNNNWVNFQKIDSVIWLNNTDVNVPESFIVFNWDGANNVWQKFEKYTYHKTGFDKPLKEENFTWNGNAWVGSMKTEYTYNLQQSETFKTVKIWNASLNDYVANSDLGKNYDNDNKLITDSTFYYDATGGLTNGSRHGYAYTQNNLLLHDTMSTYNLGVNEFIIDARKTYYYQPFISNKIITYQQQLVKVQIQPNPVVDNTVFSTSNNSIGLISIYNSSGVIVKEIKLNGAKISTDLSSLAAGIYMVKFVSLNGKLYFNKFVKQ